MMNKCWHNTVSSLAIAVICLLSLSLTAYAQNQETFAVESKSVVLNSTNQTFRVKISNDVALRALVVPLEIRSVSGGAFVTHVSASYDDRLTTALTDVQVSNIYASKTAGCLPGGGLSYADPVETSPGVLHSVSGPPVGLLFVRASFPSMPLLEPGVDVSGSIVITAHINGSPGEFIIDTICVSPANHLAIVYDLGPDFPGGFGATPIFVLGQITVSCDCHCHADPVCDGVHDALDAVTVTNVAFNGAPNIVDPSCNHDPGGRTDVNCDGFTNVLDASLMVDVVFRGGDPNVNFCDPCACSPYPTGCP